METDFFPVLSWMTSRNHAIIQAAYVLSSLCYLLIFIRLYTTKDGKFRLHLLAFFGSLFFHSLLSAIFYHPLYNWWIPIAAKVPVFVSLVKLTIYTILEFGIGGKTYVTEADSQTQP